MATEQLKIILNSDGSFKKYARDTKGATTATDSLTKSAIKLGLAYISLEGARKAFDLGAQAAKAKDVEAAFNNLANSARIDGNRMLQSMKDATRGTISEFELMQQFSTASLLGLPLDRFDEMLEIARGAAKATGESMQFMTNSIVVALGRNSKLMLDNLGILIDVESANRKYADSIGKTTSELNDFDRKQAFINEALVVGNANLERLGDLGDSDADKIQRLSGSMDNLAIAVGEQLSGPLGETSSHLADIADSLTIILQNADGIGRALSPQESLEQLAIAQNSLDSINASMDAMFAQSESGLVLITPGQIETVKQLEQQILILGGTTAVAAEATRGFKDAVIEVDETLEAEAEAIDAVIEAERLLERESLDAQNAMFALSLATDESADSFVNMANQALNALNAIERLSSSDASAFNKAASFFGGVVGFATGGFGGAAAGAEIGGRTADLLGFAKGGVSPGGPILVGERGPEIINPPAGTQITSNQATQQMLAPLLVQLVLDSDVVAEVLVRRSKLGGNQLQVQS